MPDHGQVVRDEQIGEAAFALQIFHDVQHLGLHAHIQGRCRLVTDQKFWGGGQSTRNGNTLSLPSRKLVRVLDHIKRRQANRLEQFGYSVFQLLLVFDQAMFVQGLAHNGFNRPPGIQAGIGVLENHLDALAHGLGIA